VSDARDDEVLAEVTTFARAPEVLPFVHAGEAAGFVFEAHGNPATAFEAFTGGLGAVYSRHALAELSLAAIAAPPHGNLVDAVRHLMPDPPMAPVLIEAYASGFLFGAASTFDTAAFAVNALGFAIAPSEFFSLDTEKNGLRDICAAAIAEKSSAKTRPGFANHFPRFRERLIADWAVVDRLLDHHGASKHRTATMAGWASVQNVPFGDVVAAQRDLLEGGARGVRLRAEPRLPLKDRKPHPLLRPGAIGSPRSESLDELAAAWRAALRALGMALQDDVVALIARAR
jgi:hypothetical protein